MKNSKSITYKNYIVIVIVVSLALLTCYKIAYDFSYNRTIQQYQEQKDADDK